METEHIHTARLFDAATAGLKLLEDEKAHMVVCNECKEVLAVFTRQFASNKGVISAFPGLRNERSA